MTISCPQCSSENDARRRFCNGCGTSLEIVCAGCHFSNRSGDRFCGGCGIKLEPVAVAAVVEAPPAEVSVDESKRDELRNITVMMADLDGFAQMIEVHGRERQAAVMNEVFERLANKHIVQSFDGYIDKFLDGDIMALFGAPIAHEDAPERACRAAVRMHAELAAMHAEGAIPADTPVQLRIGLNTGPVRVGGVGAGGRMEYTAMGDTVNLAARLMTASEWGGSLISTQTHRRVAQSFELAELPPVKVKGKSQPVPIWAVKVEKRRAARVELAQAAGMSRLVGRDPQIQILLDGYREAVGGQGNIIGIRGEAGIGKSRLVFELRQAVADEARYVEGRCLSYGANIAYQLLRDLFTELCDIDDADSADVRLDKVRGLVSQHGLDPAEHGPPLGFILSLDFGDREFNQLDPQELNRRLREAVFATLSSVGARLPLIVFLDDLQWCDAPSREILEDLMTRCGDSRLLVLLAYRPDFEHQYDTLGRFRLVEPQRLTVEDTRVMVGSLLRQREQITDEEKVDPSLAQAVFQKSQGNPFFIDQTVTALLERAEQTGKPTIDLRRGRLLISEDELANLVPDSVEEILLARIDKLPEAPRSLLQAASVAMIGRYFRRSALEYCLGGEHLDPLLQVLVDRDLISEASRSESDTEYAFEHALARDVAYNNLLRAERRRLHTRVGGYIEQHYAHSLSAYIDDLAYHFYNSNDARKAVDYLPPSAARASRSYSNQQAVQQYKRALEKADEVDRDGGFDGLPQVRLAVLKGLSTVQSLIGDREGLEYGRQRLDLARDLGDRDGVIDASYMLAYQYTAMGQSDEARTYWDQVLAEYEAIGKWDGVRDSEYGIGNLCYLQGRYEDALGHFERALRIQDERIEFDPFAMWIAYNNLAAANDALGRYSKVVEACQVCQDMLGKLPEDDPMRVRLECYTAGNFGSAHRNLGNLQEAVRSYQRTVEISEATGEKMIEAEGRHWLGRALMMLGQLTTARVQLDEAVVLAQESASPRWEAGALAAMCEAASLVGDWAGAEQYLAQAREVLDKVGELAGKFEVDLVQARLRLAQNRPAEAADCLREVLTAEGGSHNEGERAAALADLALAELRLADPATAEHAGEALQLAEQLGAKAVTVRALRVLGELGRQAGDPAAWQRLDDALAVAEAMGSLEETISTLSLRARLSVAQDPAAARHDLTAADDLLAAAAATAGTDYVTAARQRYLEPVSAGLTAG